MLGLSGRAEGIDGVDPVAIGTGSSVRLLELEGLGEWEVMIVSSTEADPDVDRISDQCPIGEALLGRRPGDLVLVEVPQGTMQFRVVSVSPASPAAPGTHAAGTTRCDLAATVPAQPGGLSAPSRTALWQGGIDHDYQ